MSFWWLDLPSKYLVTPPDFLLYDFNDDDTEMAIMF